MLTKQTDLSLVRWSRIFQLCYVKVQFFPLFLTVTLLSRGKSVKKGGRELFSFVVINTTVLIPGIIILLPEDVL